MKKLASVSLVMFAISACAVKSSSTSAVKDDEAPAQAGSGDLSLGQSGSLSCNAGSVSDQLVANDDGSSTLTLSDGSKSATFQIAEDGSITTSASQDDATALVDGARNSCSGAKVSSAASAAPSLSLDDDVPCRTEGLGWEGANDAVNGAAWGSLLAFVTTEGWGAGAGYPGWVAARSARNRASQILGACCYEHDPSFNTQYCREVYNLYWPLSVPR